MSERDDSRCARCLNSGTIERNQQRGYACLFHSMCSSIRLHCTEVGGVVVRNNFCRLVRNLLRSLEMASSFVLWNLAWPGGRKSSTPCHVVFIILQRLLLQMDLPVSDTRAPCARTAFEDKMRATIGNVAHCRAPKYS